MLELCWAELRKTRPLTLSLDAAGKVRKKPLSFNGKVAGQEFNLYTALNRAIRAVEFFSV